MRLARRHPLGVQAVEHPEEVVTVVPAAVGGGLRREVVRPRGKSRTLCRISVEQVRDHVLSRTTVPWGRPDNSPRGNAGRSVLEYLGRDAAALIVGSTWLMRSMARW